MRIAILSSGDGWHVRDLQRAGEQLGQRIESIDFRTISSVCGVSSSLSGSWDALANVEGVIVRTMPPGSLEQVVYRMNALHQVQACGARFLNSPRSLEVCVDKYLATAMLERAGLPVPLTVVCQDSDTAMEAFEALGRDVVLKPLFGSEGRGILRLTESALAWRTFRTLERLGAVLYLQQFIEHPGFDVRAFILDDKVLAAMRRFADSGWITNVAQGGRAEPVVLTPRETDYALRAAAAVGVAAAGVDLLPGPDGELYVLEVNAVPGWRKLSQVTDVDVASALLAQLAQEIERD